MVKYSKYTIFLLAIMSFAITSCKKGYLDLKPATTLTPEQALAAETDLKVALAGAYSSARGVDYYGRTIPVLGDIMADNTYQSAQNTNRYTLFNNYQYNITDGNVRGIWATAYNSILRTNNIINSTLAGNANVNQYKGEAYALRALAYFTLVRYFARPFTDNPGGLGVPIITTYDPDVKPGRNTIAEVYTLIQGDLTQAFNLMSASTFTNSSQFSKYAARGLQAKVYLTMGDKTNALTAALDVINNGGFVPATSANYVAYWRNPAISTTKGETLYEVSSDAVNNLAFDALPYIYTQTGNYGDLLHADDLYAMFQVGDVRRDLYPTGFRPAGVPVVFVEKYPSILSDRSDTKVLRLSEMYLIAAEASYPSNEVNARTYLNFITSRRNAAANISTGAQLFEDIINERRKELAFEGDRYMDLQRLKRAVSRSSNYPAAAQNIPYSDYRRVLPIPQAELDANPTIRPQQNAGW